MQVSEETHSGEIPRFEVVPAPTLVIPGQIDSNIPAFWQYVQGLNRLHVVTSWWTPNINSGFALARLGTPQPVKFLNSSDAGKWIEAVLQNEDGTLYGYYHHEPIGLCPGTRKTAPRIGALRSMDNGASWEDLGIILEIAAAIDCSSPNEYFAGGVGDFSVILDQQKIDAYFFISIYSWDTARQGVAVARMPWAQRDTPRGNMAVWDGEAWRTPPRNSVQLRRLFLTPAPIYQAAISWHDRSGEVDAFWGPSVHWNTFLNKYVMLLNRASDFGWSQEGIYIAFSPLLADPSKWTKPIKLFDGGPHYPQVLGLERGSGTDKVAAAKSRLFLRGQSDYFLVFRK
jgi:hypothetical protein